MRILHCLHNYYPAIGGAEWLMKNVSDRLARKGHDVQVIATNAYSVEDYFLPKKGEKLMPVGKEQIDGVSVKRVPFSRRGARCLNLSRAIANRAPLPYGDKLKMISWGPRSHSYEKEVMRMRNVDLIAASPLPTLNIWYAWKAAKGKKLPLVIIPCFHTEDKWTFHNQLFYKILREADAVICLTDWERRYLHDAGHIDEKNLHSFGIGIDVDEGDSAANFPDRSRISQKEIVLFLGQHGAHKGILPLIEAMKYVWNEIDDVALVIAGNPTAHTLEIEKKISGLDPSCRSRVYLFKSVSETEKKALLRSANIFVSVSPFESFGIVFLEAWREKLPVIGCNKGGSAKLIDEFRDGLLVENGNSLMLAGAILELLENKEIRKKMGEQGFRKLLAKYTWDKIMDRWENLYLEIIRRKRESL